MIDISNFISFIPMIIQQRSQIRRKTLEVQSYSWNDANSTLNLKKYRDRWEGTLIFKCSNSSQRKYTGCFSLNFQLEGKGTLQITHNYQTYFKIYCLNWNRNEPNGYCIMQNAFDDTEFQGFIYGFKKQSFGKITFKKEVEIEGMWKDGMLRGKVYIKAKGDILREAIYQDNKFVKYIDGEKMEQQKQTKEIQDK